ALGNFHRPAVATALLDEYSAASPAVRERILGLLCSRTTWAKALIAAVGRKQIPAKDLALGQVQQVVRLGDPKLSAGLERYWGKVPRSGAPEKLRRIAEVRGLLAEGDKGNSVRGKPVFQEHCAVCHRLFGLGETIGPDLTGADRGNLDFLLTSLVDPSS